MTDKNTDRTPATVDNTPAAFLSLTPANDEWGDIDAIDLAPVVAALRIPHVAINRKSDGGAVDPSTGEVMTEFACIVLGRAQSRAQWDQAFSGASAGPPDCRSFDAVVPDATSPARKAEDCANCEFNRYTGPGDFARCHLSEQWLAFLIDGDGQGGEYVRLRWGGLAASPAAMYWSSFARRKPKIRPFEVVTNVKLIPTKNDNGTFLVPDFRRGERLTRAMVEPLITDLKSLRASFAGAVAESVASGEDDNGTPVADTPPGQPAPFPEYDKPLGGQALVDQLVGAGATVVENEPF